MIICIINSTNRSNFHLKIAIKVTSFTLYSFQKRTKTTLPPTTNKTDPKSKQANATRNITTTTSTKNKTTPRARNSLKKALMNYAKSLRAQALSRNNRRKTKSRGIHLCRGIIQRSLLRRGQVKVMGRSRAAPMLEGESRVWIWRFLSRRMMSLS